MLPRGERIDLEIFTQPTKEFAGAASTVGAKAWQDRFDYRVNAGETITAVFDRDNPNILLSSLKTAHRKVGKWVGVLAVAYDDEYAAPVGFAWAANDLSGNRPTRLVKRAASALRLTSRQPYAWLGQINTLPRVQGYGIGNAMLHTVLNEFDPRQQTSTYVFEENIPTQDWMEHRRYARTVGTQEATYFGPGSRPATLLRYQAAVPDVLAATPVPRSLITDIIRR